jgi:hypothetical protein
MSRPEDAVAQVTERLGVFWKTLEGYKSRYRAGEDFRFYTLVQQGVEQLLYEDEESYPPHWQPVKVWKPIRLKPGEAERRIRSHVREWLREARDALDGRWWATEDIDNIGRDVDAWFGPASDPVHTHRAGAGSGELAAALRHKVEELERADTEKNEEIVILRLAMQRIKKQLDDSRLMVETQRKQIALLENPERGRLRW